MRATVALRLLSSVTTASLVMGCSSSGSLVDPDATADASTDTAAPTDGAPADDSSVDAIAQLRVMLSFDRLDGTGAFRATARVARGDTPEKGARVAFDCPRGTMSAVRDDGDGVSSVLVTPDAIRTGEYRVHAVVSGTSPIVEAWRTALVLGAVDDCWGQPEAVSGLVNTPAWEDSVGVTADGEWLFLEYLPVAIDCLIFHSKEPTHPTCARARGPMAAPQRPGMPGASRVAADGTIRNACPSFGLDPAPFPVPPQSLFGFHRQPDGSYAEPFAISIEGVDGCLSAFGPSPIAPATGGAGPMRLLFAFDDPSDGETPGGGSGSDLFVRDLTLGAPTSLGHLASGAFTIDGTPLGFPKAGSTGNPSQAIVADSVRAVFFDDETKADGDRDLYVREVTGTFPAGPFGDMQKLPDTIAQPGTEEIQPAFADGELFFRRGNDLLSTRYLGGAFASASSWSAVRHDLDGATSTTVAALRTLGEPNAATRAGKRVLFFVYAVNAPDGTIDLNVGLVEGR